MKPTRSEKNGRCLRSLFVVACLISLSACAGSRNSIQGKWEGTIVSKPGGQTGKVIYEFLPDGTFNAMPPGDTTVVDRDKYQVLDEGRTIKLRSDIIGGDATCTFVGDALKCEAEKAHTDFKKL